MNRQEAIQILMTAGRDDDVQKAIESTTDSAHRAYEHIRADATRTAEWKRRELAVAASRYDTALTEALVKMAGTASTSDHGDAAKVFGVAGLPGDPASLAISRRDAGDRVAGINSPDELRELLVRATRTGDETLARAIAERALEIRDAKTLEKFADDRPDLDAAVERLWKLDRRKKHARDSGMHVAILLGGLKPAELSDMSFGSIKMLASTEPSGASLSDPNGRIAWR